VHSRLQETGVQWLLLKMTFERWLGLMDSARCCQIEGRAPQRVIWPRENGRAKKFECADYFVPQDRLPPTQIAVLVRFLRDNVRILTEVYALLTLILHLSDV
jgi:hypothetical protein